MEYHIKKGGHADLKRIYPMMEFDFCTEELEPRLAFHLALLERKAELLLLKDDEGVEHGYALVLTDSSLGFVLAGWLGIYPTEREKGVGRQFITLVCERYAAKRGIVIEVTRETGKGERLRGLYESFGWEDTGIPYSIGGEPYALMCRYTDGGPPLQEPVARLFMKEIYSALMPERLAEKKYRVGDAE